MQTWRVEDDSVARHGISYSLFGFQICRPIAKTALPLVTKRKDQLCIVSSNPQAADNRCGFPYKEA